LSQIYIDTDKKMYRGKCSSLTFNNQFEEKRQNVHVLNNYYKLHKT